MRTFTWSILGVLVAGCTGKGGDTSPSVAECGSFSGVQSASTTWVWELDVDTTTAALTSQITALDTSGFTLDSSYHYATQYVDATIDTTATYGCDTNGMSLLSSVENDDITTTNEGESLDTKTTTYDSPYLILPLTIAFGDSWESTVKGATDDSASGNSSAFDYSTTSTVAAKEDISVSAGDYSTLRVETDAAGATEKSWYAENTGLVQADDRALSSYTP